MTTVTFPAVGNAENALFFYPMRLRSLDSGRLFSAKIAFCHRACTTPRYGRFCGTFSAAPARPFLAAQVIAPSRPAKGCAPFDPRQGSPCTCPAPPFTARPGLCFTRRLALENQELPSWHSEEQIISSLISNLSSFIILRARRSAPPRTRDTRSFVRSRPSATDNRKPVTENLNPNRPARGTHSYLTGRTYPRPITENR